MVYDLYEAFVYFEEGYYAEGVYRKEWSENNRSETIYALDYNTARKNLEAKFNTSSSSTRTKIQICKFLTLLSNVNMAGNEVHFIKDCLKKRVLKKGDIIRLVDHFNKHGYEYRIDDIQPYINKGYVTNRTFRCDWKNDTINKQMIKKYDLSGWQTILKYKDINGKLVLTPYVYKGRTNDIYESPILVEAQDVLNKEDLNNIELKENINCWYSIDQRYENFTWEADILILDKYVLRLTKYENKPHVIKYLKDI